MCHAVSLDKELLFLRAINSKESSETFEIWAKILRRDPELTASSCYLQPAAASFTPFTAECCVSAVCLIKLYSL